MDSPVFLNFKSSTEKKFGKSITDVFSHGLEFTSFVLSDGIFGILEDSDTINNEIFSNVVGERPWVGIDSGHLFKFYEISSDSFAVSDGSFDFDNTSSDFLKTGKSIGSIFFFEKCDTIFNVGEDKFGIFDAVLNAIKSFSFESSNKDTSDNFGNFFDVDSFIL